MGAEPVGQSLLVPVVLAVDLVDVVDVLRAVGEPPPGVLPHLQEPVRHARLLIAGRYAVGQDFVKTLLGVVAVALREILGDVLLPVRVGRGEQVAVEGALHHAVHGLCLTGQQQAVEGLAHRYLCVHIGRIGAAEGHRPGGGAQCLAAQQVMPHDGRARSQGFPGEDKEVGALLHDVEVQILQQLLQHAVLLPHIILSVAQEEELRDAEVAEDAPLVGSGIVHRLAPVIPKVQGAEVAQPAH